MPFAHANGLQLHYREAGDGFPIVLVHGYTGNSRNWALTIPALRQRFRTISVDLRGHGHSDKPARPQDYTLESLAGDVHALVRHLGLRECYLAGHSMGGYVAQHLALREPEPFRALVLVDTAAEAPDGMRTQERARLEEIARTQGMEAVFEERLRIDPQAAQLRAQPQFLEKWREQFLLTSVEAYLYCASQAMGHKPLLDELPAIKIPTLIICGENDEPFLGPSRRIHERIPSSQLEIIAGAGHGPQMEKPAEFNRLLTEFLAKVHQTVAAGG